MQTKTESKISLTSLAYMPDFAGYILSNRLEEYVDYQLALSKEMNIPILKIFSSFTNEQLKALSLKTSREFLTYFIENKAAQQIEDGIASWLANRLPMMDRYDIVAEDLTMISYIRKQAFLQFLPDYCDNNREVLEILKEIDLFCLESEMRSINEYLRLLKGRIEEHTHFIEKVNNTTPSAIFVFDIEKFKGIYANDKLSEIIGYSHEELNKLGNDAIIKLTHPDDRNVIMDNLHRLVNAKDKETLSYSYRILHRDGNYRWIRSYESVFKRHANGQVWQTIGITLDIDQEKKLEEELQKSNLQLLEAQDIAQIGSFFWDFENKFSGGSAKTFEILETEPNNYKDFIAKVHPSDRRKVEGEIKKSFDIGLFDCEFRLIGKNSEKVIWSRGVVDFKDGRPVSMKGTVMDVTERHKILEELNKSDQRYKQAEAITHIGNYIWDLKTNDIEWSDELFRIYGLQPKKEKLSFEEIEKFNHPDDVEATRKHVRTALQGSNSFDFYYRIIIPDNKIRILHARGEFLYDKGGNATKVLGTAQDVTEKQMLIAELRDKEFLYRQAEELANMGNWTWNVQENKLKWTDQLYRIYGLDPQTESITIETFLSHVHPDDRKAIEDGIEKINYEDLLDYTFRIITSDGKCKTLRSIARVQRNENGQPDIVYGTERDITEKQNLILQLKESESLYKQAQLLAHVGNWTWDMKDNRIFWSDELFHIFEIEPSTSPMTYEKYISLIHPDDREKVQMQVKQASDTHRPWEFTHRIKTATNNEKIIYSTGEVLTDPSGIPYRMIGTAQDVTEKQRLIDGLEKSEMLYKQAQQIAHIGNWSYNYQNGRSLWSEEMYRIYNVDSTDSDIDWKIFFEKIHPDDQNAVQEAARHTMNTGAPFEIHHRISMLNGGEKMVFARGTVEKDKNGNPVQLVGTAQDVTEQYRIEKELRDNQTFIRKITDATPSIIASYNINTGSYVFISEGLEKLLGYNTGYVLKKGIAFFMDIIHPEDAPLIMEKNAKAMQEANANISKNDTVIEFTYRMKHKNGEYRWFHTYGTIFDRNKEGKVEHVLNISLDVTEQIEATEKIKEQEHFIQQIADASPTILYLFDVPSQSIQYINREIFFVLGYLPEEITDTGPAIVEKLYHPDEYNLLPERTISGKNFQQVDSMIQYECRIRNKEEEWRWFVVREIVFKTDENGNVKQILGAALDINRRKEMEKTILQNTLLLEQSNASLEEFAYIASHDLKEPLRKISTFGDRLVATQLHNLNPEGKVYINKIVDASHRMQTMISDLLSISMITGNTSFEIYNLQKILEDTLQTLDYKIEQQHAVIRSEILPEAKIIASQFRQLFQNLLSNSLKFVREGVQPIITIKHCLLKKQQTAQYQLSQAENYHKIEFTDNGIGFENEYSGKIFAIFQRLHGRSEYEGSGIGLAICKKIIEHHGGIIYAKGEVGKGSTFTIILPA